MNLVEGWTMVIGRNQNNHFLIESLGVSRYSSVTQILMYGRVYLTPCKESWCDDRPMEVGRKILLTGKNSVRMVCPKNDYVGFSVKYEKVCEKCFVWFFVLRK